MGDALLEQYKKADFKDAYNQDLVDQYTEADFKDAYNQDLVDQYAEAHLTDRDDRMPEYWKWESDRTYQEEYDQDIGDGRVPVSRDARNQALADAALNVDFQGVGGQKVRARMIRESLDADLARNDGELRVWGTGLPRFEWGDRVQGPDTE